MDLSSLFGGDAMSNYTNLVNGMAGLYGGIKGAQTANNVNNQIQPALQQNNAATQAQIDSLNQQINQNRQQAQDMYQRSLTDVTGQNQGLQGNIDTQTASLNALSDPNSAYMQQARQAIERKDAAAGRNSQWGDREVQLAGTLADYVGKYSPGIQNSITQARNQINQNNQGLASLYATANQPADRNTLAQIAALQQQLSNVGAMNTTGRGAANAATNSISGYGGAIQSGMNALGGLAGLFGGKGGGGLSGYTQDQATNSGFNGWGGDLSLGYGLGANGLSGGYLDTAGNGALGAGLNFSNGLGDSGMGGYSFPGSVMGTGYGAYDNGSYQAPLDFNDPSSGWWD